MSWLTGVLDIPRAFLKEIRESWLHKTGRLKVTLFLTGKEVAGKYKDAEALLSEDSELRGVVDGVRFGRLNAQTMCNEVSDREGHRTCLLCGPRGFMEIATDALVHVGVAEERIKTESFEY